MSFAIITFGCRVNQADSLRLESELRSHGAEAVSPEEAETIIVNTCSVTASADQGARQTIRRLSRVNAGARIVVTGCYATRRPDELAALPHVARVVPNDDKDGLASLITSRACGEPSTAERYGGAADGCGEWHPGLGGRTALTLRVQTGCEERCSYCIIPQTRGRGRSLPLPVVLRRVEQAIAAGYKEIVITGVHLGSYGRDLADGTSLETLVAALGSRDGDVLFRISSLEPMDCTPGVVACIERSSRLAPHFHLPLQHGSDRMLAAMRRPYSAAAYVRLVADIARRIPHASIGSDIIVGFPGETEREFDEMCALLRRVPLTHLHVFPYSDRPDTAASRVPDKVDGATIRARASAIRAIGADKSAAFRSSQVGRCVRALTVDDGRSAVTPNYLKVRLDVEQRRNEWIVVEIEDGDPLRGRVLGFR